MPHPLFRYADHRFNPDSDHLAVEEPLEIRVRGRSIAITMRTPGHDDELAAGFLLCENIITRPDHLLRIEHCARDENDNTLDILLAPEVPVDFARLTRHVFASSSCGLCGKATIAAIHTTFPPVSSSLTLSADILTSLPGKMRAAQPQFDQTGGLHAAALFNAHGDLLIAREDVGRHNAVDKVLGRALLDNLLPLDRHILLVSGRASFEILQKSLAARIPVVAAISAPSSLAVDFAQQSNQTLAAFLRENKMNIYTHPQRITAQVARV